MTPTQTYHIDINCSPRVACKASNQSYECQHSDSTVPLIEHDHFVGSAQSCKADQREVHTGSF